MPEPLRAAVRAVPRHRFVHRYRLDGDLRAFAPDSEQAWTDAYADLPLTHVDAADDALPSTNSQPSFVLWLLHLLDPRPAQRVLEIGSGSGWLVGLIAHLVGPTGRVVGVEIIESLAAQSRADLAGLGISHVEIRAGDAASLDWRDQSFERVMITASVWDVPGFLFDALAEDGLLLAPIEGADGGGTLVTLLRRRGRRLVSEHALAGWFVPLLGAGQERRGDPQRAQDTSRGLAPSLREALEHRLRLTVMPATAPELLPPGPHRRIEPRGDSILVWEDS